MAAARQRARRITKRAQREEQILAAAFEEFASNGYAAARLDDVAKRAKIAKGTIFLHFRNKRILFRAVLRSCIQHAFSGFDVSLQDFAGTSGALLCNLLSRQYAEIVRNRRARALLRLLIAESGNFPELTKMYYREIIGPGTSAFRLVVDRGVASGEFQATAIRKFPQILAAPTMLAIVYILVLGERHGFDIDEYRRAHLEFVLRALHGSGSTNPPAGTKLTPAGEAL